MNIPVGVWIAAIVTLGLYFVSHLVISVWWASKVDTLLNGVQTELKEIITEMKAHRLNTFTKEDAARELGHIEKEHKLLWNRQDEIREEIIACKNGK